MKQTVLRYGLYGAAIVAVFGTLNCLLPRDTISWETSEIVGYLTIVVSLIFVFFGMRHYRDRFNSGQLSFGQGMKVGILIVLLPSIAFGLFSVLLTEVIDPDWSNKYYEYQTQKLAANSSPEELSSKMEEMEKSKELFSNPLYNFFLMAATVFVIGLIVTIISALALRTRKFKTQSITQ